MMPEASAPANILFIIVLLLVLNAYPKGNATTIRRQDPEDKNLRVRRNLPSITIDIATL
jgi:hypothetical protein